jgi:acetate kinase
MRACQSIATTMGFTAVDGLPMGTRCGALDPGVVLFLMDEMKLGPRELGSLAAAANARHGPRISTPGSAAAAFVILTDEESMIARHVMRVLQA